MSEYSYWVDVLAVPFAVLCVASVGGWILSFTVGLLRGLLR